MDDSQLPSQGEYGTLTCCVCKLGRGSSHQSNNGSGVDDGALRLLVLAKRQDGVLAAEPHALDVDVVCQIPDFLGGVDGVFGPSVAASHIHNCAETYQRHQHA